MSILLAVPMTVGQEFRAFAASWDQTSFVAYSSAMKSASIKLSKISNDLILLASGPREGPTEINLPTMQLGSSITPGKVNPAIPEMMNVIAFRVMGNDAGIGVAALKAESSEPSKASSG